MAEYIRLSIVTFIRQNVNSDVPIGRNLHE